MSDATPGRRWGAALAATFVTLVAMQVLGLYRSRLCVQRGQEMARIVIAVLAGPSRPLSLIRGHGVGATAQPVVAGSSALLP